MKICERGVNSIQVINAEGDVRVCCLMRDNIIGNLNQQDMKAIMHGERAHQVRQPLIDGTYINCSKDNCPYLANDDMDQHIIELEQIPDYPAELLLAYEGVCNYSCTCCTSYSHMQETKMEDKNAKYDVLEEKLREILPHVRHIGANGRGELFASKRTLKLLSEWQPLAPKEEISASLETNGSLFDEKHWKQIQNLGQYHLSVAITVMSFDEAVYQYLSGTKLPINRIEDNLRFVKKLREDGVINYLELATVLQEANFREMPQFTERCLNEFGADKVRIRPVMPGGRLDNSIQWFMDVRNPNHPYYEDYCKVMFHPIFSDSRVLLWSGDMPSTRGEHPGIKSTQIQKLSDYILNQQDIIKPLKKIANVDELSEIDIYGVGTIGKLLICVLEGNMSVRAVYDSYAQMDCYRGIPVKRLNEIDDEAKLMLVTVYGDFEQIARKIADAGYKGRIVNAYDLLKEVN